MSHNHMKYPIACIALTALTYFVFHFTLPHQQAPLSDDHIFDVSRELLQPNQGFETPEPGMLFSEPMSNDRAPDGSICGDNAWRCHNVAGLEYINALRAADNASSLSLGTDALLSKAQAHSKEMSANQAVYHEEIIGISLGCSTEITGESVVSVLGDKSTDSAALCIGTMVRSAENYYKLIAEKHRSAAIGIAIDITGNIWCTVLYSNGTDTSNDGCGNATSSDIVSDEVMSPIELPELETSTNPTDDPLIPENQPVEVPSGHIYRHRLFNARLDNEVIEPMYLKCRRGVCKFCTLDGSLCLTSEKSVEMDKNLPSSS